MVTVPCATSIATTVHVALNGDINDAIEQVNADGAEP
jgi:hypothetical protein